MQILERFKSLPLKKQRSIISIIVITLGVIAGLIVIIVAQPKAIVDTVNKTKDRINKNNEPKEEEIKLETYKSEHYGFEIKFPESWEVETNTENEYYPYVAIGEKNVVYVQVDGYLMGDVDFCSYLGGGTDFEASIQQITINGKPADLYKCAYTDKHYAGYTIIPFDETNIIGGFSLQIPPTELEQFDQAVEALNTVTLTKNQLDFLVPSEFSVTFDDEIYSYSNYYYFGLDNTTIASGGNSFGVSAHVTKVKGSDKNSDYDNVCLIFLAKYPDGSETTLDTICQKDGIFATSGNNVKHQIPTRTDNGDIIKMHESVTITVASNSEKITLVNPPSKTYQIDYNNELDEVTSANEGLGVLKVFAMNHAANGQKLYKLPGGTYTISKNDVVVKTVTSLTDSITVTDLEPGDYKINVVLGDFVQNGQASVTADNTTNYNMVLELTESQIKTILALSDLPRPTLRVFSYGLASPIPIAGVNFSVRNSSNQVTATAASNKYGFIHFTDELFVGEAIFSYGVPAGYKVSDWTKQVYGGDGTTLNNLDYGLVYLEAAQ